MYIYIYYFNIDNHSHNMCIYSQLNLYDIYNIPPGRTLAQNSIGGSVTSGFHEGLFRVGLGVGVDLFGVI